MAQMRPRGDGAPPPPPVVKPLPPAAEFHFIRMQYVDYWGARRGGFGGGGGRGRGWWMQDWPEAEMHFAQGIKRLTRIDIGENRYLPLTDDRIFDYPWIYCTQAGYWDLSKAETDRLGEYLKRGGYLIVDDFYGMQDWEIFREAIERAMPGQPILDLAQDDQVMRTLYTITERTFIPGLRHLRRGPGGSIVTQPQEMPPIWRAVYDSKHRMVVAINFNMDVGDAWEHADWPEYPEAMTSLAYRFGINYIIYAMTH